MTQVAEGRYGLLKVLFVEPPKEFWFVMGEYLPPPLGILQLAAYLEEKVEKVEIEVLDCQAKKLDWRGLEGYIESFDPDIVASSSLATCNAYIAIRTLDAAKRANPEVLTITGGQHFSALARESMETYPEIDIIVNGEGEQTLVELVKVLGEGRSLSHVNGITYRHDRTVKQNPPRAFIENLDDLPFPGYHFVEDIASNYHFTMMAGPNIPYALVEGSRGCPHRCTFCTQWRHWGGTFRAKSAKRIAEEMEFCYRNYGSRFIWLTDDNIGIGKRMNELCEELIQRGLSEDIMWFFQARCDDVAKHSDLLPKMRKAGNRWVLLGVESLRRSTLEAFNKDINPEDAWKAVKLLKENDIFAQTMFIIGERKDTSETIAEMREFANDLDPDMVIFMVLTPFPGTEVFEEAWRNGWVEDLNWSHYDMTHAIMPTESLSRDEVQEELYGCYRDFYGSWSRKLKGIFSPNKLKRRTYRYLASQGLLQQLRNLF